MLDTKPIKGNTAFHIWFSSGVQAYDSVLHAPTELVPKGFGANKKYSGCCVFEAAAADFCDSWLIHRSGSLKLTRLEISLKYFANEHY